VAGLDRHQTVAARGPAVVLQAGRVSRRSVPRRGLGHGAILGWLVQPRQRPVSHVAPNLCAEGGVAALPGKVVAVSRINRAPIRGSLLVSVFGNVGGERVHLGTEAVLSRWNVQYCANCQTHLEVRAFFDVPPAGQGAMALAAEEQLSDSNTYQVEIQTRDGRLTDSAPPPSAAAAGPLPTEAHRPRPLYRVVVR
jgi:tyrosinase